MTQELITMTKKELFRHEIISRLVDKKINGTEASIQLNLSVRQTKRLKKKFKQFGPKGIIHKSRGKPSNRKIDQLIINKAVEHLKNHYHDFHPTHAKEKLEEVHFIKLSKETVRKIMIKEELWKVKSKKEKERHRLWRPRKDYYGEMEQFDGSRHKWFEDRAPQCCLLASIDDATGKITHLKFTKGEGTYDVNSFWREYIEDIGLPLKIYLDRHVAYKKNHKNVFDDPESLTQFERAMKDLGIEIIHAYSPQAKGRVEALFGTLQNRLIKELRLAGISIILVANKFLKEIFIPYYNNKYAIEPSREGNLHRELGDIQKQDLDKIFAIQCERVVLNDFTVRHKGKWYQLLKNQTTLVLRKDKVLIEERLNGEIFISLRNKCLNFKELPQRPQKTKERITALTKEPKHWKPPATHPWKRSYPTLNTNIKEEFVSINK